jgi:preprotein translocase subunit SecG
MIILLTIIHILVCLFLIIVVLLQSGKAADLAGAFGGMGSQTAFGPRGAATMLSKATTIAAVVFMITSIWLGIEQGRLRGGNSVLDQTGAGTAAPAPAPVETTPAGGAVPKAEIQVTPTAPAPEGAAAPENAAPANTPNSTTPAPTPKQ